MNNYHFEEHHLLLRDQVRRMVDKHVAPIASEIDENCRFPEELVEIFGDMGLLQLWVPQEYGGPGGDLTSVCLVKEEIAKASESAALLAAQQFLRLDPADSQLRHRGAEAALSRPRRQGPHVDRRRHHRGRHRLRRLVHEDARRAGRRTAGC